MVVTANNLKELDCSYEIVKDCTLKDGTTLRRGSEFIIDDCNSRNEVCMHFPINENNNIYASEYTNKEIWISAAHMQLISKVKFNDVVRIDKERHDKSKDLSYNMYNEHILKKQIHSESKKKDTYLKTIKELSSRYNIPKNEILDIVNSIENNNEKSNSIQKERTL